MNTPAETAPLRLLVVEDSELDYELLLATVKRDASLAGRALRAQRVEDEPGMREAFARGPVDAVVTDHNMPRFDSFAALAVAKEIDVDLPVLVVSGEMSEDLAVAALHAGADDFVLKTRLFRIGPALAKSLDAAANRRERRAQAQRLQELTAHLEQVKEEERRTIAREIHDDIGSTLTALKFELARLASCDLPAVAAAHLQTMQGLIANAVAASHRIQHDLRPPVLDAGLVAALDWLVKGFGARAQAAVRFESNREDIDLPATHATALYRVAQEALNNVARHAAAGRVNVTLFDSTDDVTLEIADDGAGFDPRLLAATPGFGLRGLIERARALGGWAEIDSGPGRGTTIMFCVPRGDGRARADEE
jgi:signal transduction histidine kinase